MYLLLCISLALNDPLAVNLLAAGLASAIWQTLAAKAAKLSPTMRSQLTFGLRILPFTGAGSFRNGVRSARISDPRTRDVRRGGRRQTRFRLPRSRWRLLPLLILFYCTWVITRRLTIRWQADAEPIEVDGVRMCRYLLITHKYPLLAGGVLKPRKCPSPDRFWRHRPGLIEAAVAHEYGHLNSRQPQAYIAADLPRFAINTLR